MPYIRRMLEIASQIARSMKLESFTSHLQHSCPEYIVCICCYIITRVHSSFLLVENRDLLEDRRTAHAISVTSQSPAFQNYQQPMLCFV